MQWSHNVLHTFRKSGSKCNPFLATGEEEAQDSDEEESSSEEENVDTADQKSTVSSSQSLLNPAIGNISINPQAEDDVPDSWDDGSEVPVVDSPAIKKIQKIKASESKSPIVTPFSKGSGSDLNEKSESDGDDDAGVANGDDGNQMTAAEMDALLEKSLFQVFI